MAANFWVSRDRLRSFAWFLTIFGLAFSLFALIQGLTWNERFYWVRPIARLTAPYGPFPSHNNYAGFIELFIPAAIAIALNVAVSRPARMFAGFAAAIMGISVAFSLSRGGMISVAAGVIFFIAISIQLSLARRRAIAKGEARESGGWLRALVVKQGAVVVGIVGLILAGLLWLGPDTIASRLTQGSLRSDDPQGENFQNSRGWIWKDTWTIFKANPVVGTGLGAFRTAFPMYTASDGSVRASWAHNDYLQMLSDGGVIGGVLALWFIVATFRAFGTGLRAREPWRLTMVLAAGAGIFSLLVHSIFDFNLQIPSTMLLFLVLAGIVGGIAQSVEERERQISENANKMEPAWESRVPAPEITSVS